MESRRKTVGIVAPAGVPDPQGIERGIALVESWGFKVTTGAHLGSRYRYFAGTAEERADDLRHMLMDPSIDIVWLERGGFGCAHLLEHLPDDAIVLLEDVTEFGYQLDRSLTQLRLSGAFDGARAFVLGQFTRCPIPDGADFTLEQMLVDVLGGFGLPIYSGLPIGHEHRNITWQYGNQAAIENSAIRFVA